METLGHHYIVEGSGCNPAAISRVEDVEQIMVRAAEIANVQVWAISFHRFIPNGVSGVVVISESHLSVHTWPEQGYVALDIYTCGEKAKPEAAVQHALKAFGASNMHITEVTRGLDEQDQVFFHSMITWEETIPDNILNHKPRRRRRVTRRRRPSLADRG
jgi:S-adenosylmethionine decarboxylase